MGVGSAQVLLARGPALAECVKQRFLEVQRCVHQPLRDGGPVHFGEILRLGQQPVQQVKRAGQNDHFVGHTLSLHSDRYTHLIAWPNLLEAVRKAARGKRGHPPAATFEHQVADRLLALQTELTTFTYTPGEYVSFMIHDPKLRKISAAPFRDRVVHHALCSVIEPLFEARFIPDSYANRVGKGTHRAIDRLQTLARQYRYVLRCDIRKFFPAIDHAIMHDVLADVIREDDVLWLCDQILASGAGVLADEYDMVWFPGDDASPGGEVLAALRPRGLPIGNLTSQF